jgi:aerotaxis receptor
MPAEAFADMWRSLRLGRSWSALVKNRRKNGDHYWVRANAAPMRRQGVLTGYLSVRTRPERADIEQAEALYARFRNGQSRGWRFHRGLVVRTGALAWLSALQLMPTAWRLRLPLLVLGLVWTGLLAGAGLGGAALAWAVPGLLALLAVWGGLEHQLVAPLERIQGWPNRWRRARRGRTCTCSAATRSA